MTISYKDSPAVYESRRIATLSRIIQEVNPEYYIADYCSNLETMDSSGFEHILIKEKASSWWRSDKHICYVDINNVYKPGGFVVYVEIGGGKMSIMNELAKVFDDLRWVVTIIDNGT